MSLTITPIGATEIEQTTQPFFAPEFISQQLGKLGVFLGDESKRMQLKDPVERAVLDNLLLGKSPNGTSQPGGIWRSVDQPVGWKMTFELDWRHNTVWALGNEEIRHLADFHHAVSVKNTVEQLDQVLRRAAGFEAKDRVGAVFACFQSGTGEGQVPGLRSTIIVPQSHLRDDGSIMTFPAEVFSKCQARLFQAYLCEFVPRAVHSFGSIGAPTAKVPKGLFKPLARDPLIAGGAAKEGNLVFGGEDLFTQWRRQAERNGFGEREFGDMLHQAREHARGYYKPLDPEAPGIGELFKGLTQKLWAYCLSPNFHHDRQTEHTKSHHPAL